MSDFLMGMVPADIGLPHKFKRWYDIQREAAEQAIYGEKRFQALNLPCGTGKTLIVRTIAMLTGMRTVTLTSTKGLQNQYETDFGFGPVHNIAQRLIGKEDLGQYTVDIRGKGNYQCTDHAHLQCDDGQRAGCRRCGTLKCPYAAALSIAQRAPHVVTNYSYWFAINRKGMGLVAPLKPEPIELLVIDEAHLVHNELSEFLQIRIGEKEIRDLLHVSPPGSDDPAEWKVFGRDLYKDIKAEVKARTAKLAQMHPVPKIEIDKIKKLDGLADRLEQLAKINLSMQWVGEEHTGGRFGRYWQFDPVWPGAFAESALFQGIPRVLLLSATIRPKTMSLLGVKQDQYNFREWPRIFPPNRSPVIHVPTVRLNWRITDQQMKEWVSRIDEIIAGRLDRKGIIHTVSYQRQQYLLDHSKYGKLMMGNTSDPNSETAREIVLKFKQAKAPCILVSPSFSTGWDFPGDECEYQIIGKIPFPDSKSKVMKARKDKDPQYMNYAAMQELVQMCGRGMRAHWDRCETLIVDDSIGWFLYQARCHAPKWFDVRKTAQVPPPPVSLKSDPQVDKLKRAV